MAETVRAAVRALEADETADVAYGRWAPAATPASSSRSSCAERSRRSHSTKSTRAGCFPLRRASDTRRRGHRNPQEGNDSDFVARPADRAETLAAGNAPLGDASEILAAGEEALADAGTARHSP